MKKSDLLIIGAGAVAAVVAIWLAKKTATVAVDVVKTAATAINPFNNDNIINQGFNGLYTAATGSDSTLGSDVYDVTHNGTLNPTSDNNIINKGFNGLYGWETGSKGTLGSDIYDWTH